MSPCFHMPGLTSLREEEIMLKVNIKSSKKDTEKQLKLVNGTIIILHNCNVDKPFYICSDALHDSYEAIQYCMLVELEKGYIVNKQSIPRKITERKLIQIIYKDMENISGFIKQNKVYLEVIHPDNVVIDINVLTEH